MHNTGTRFDIPAVGYGGTFYKNVNGGYIVFFENEASTFWSYPDKKVQDLIEEDVWIIKENQ